jgi:SAM-dependent methyltransferase
LRKRSGRILDIGCAAGTFLAHFAPEAWERHGVELSQLATEAASRRGILVHRGVIGETEFPEGLFDVVTCLDTFYYFPAPRQDLLKIHRVLKPEGLLVLELPGYAHQLIRNVGPVSVVVNGRWCHMSSASRQLFYYNKRSLAKLLERTGFRIEQAAPEQSPLQGSAAVRALNHAHFAVSRIIFRATSGSVNLAAKTVYVCTKTRP